MFLFFAASQQRILDFFQRRQNRLFVTNESLLLSRILDFDILSDARAGKNRPAHARPKRPKAATGAEKIARVYALQTCRAGQEESREQVGSRDADASRSGS